MRPGARQKAARAPQVADRRLLSVLKRCVTLTPVIDGVEGTYTKSEAAGAIAKQGLKFIGNVPADGRAPGGILRHKGWKAAVVDLPKVGSAVNLNIIAPAEIEVE